MKNTVITLLCTSLFSVASAFAQHSGTQSALVYNYSTKPVSIQVVMHKTWIKSSENLQVEGRKTSYFRLPTPVSKNFDLPRGDATMEWGSVRVSIADHQKTSFNCEPGSVALPADVHPYIAIEVHNNHRCWFEVLG